MNGATTGPTSTACQTAATQYGRSPNDPILAGMVHDLCSSPTWWQLHGDTVIVMICLVLILMGITTAVWFSRRRAAV